MVSMRLDSLSVAMGVRLQFQRGLTERPERITGASVALGAVDTWQVASTMTKPSILPYQKSDVCAIRCNGLWDSRLQSETSVTFFD